jgi:calcineurin-like phosphoesterase family protein
MVDNVVVSDSGIDLKVLWENLEGRIVLAFGRVNSSRKSGFHDPNEFFIVVFSEEENPWLLHHPERNMGSPSVYAVSDHGESVQKSAQSA